MNNQLVAPRKIFETHSQILDKQKRIIALGDSSVFGVGDFGDNFAYTGAGWTGRFAHDVGATAYANVAKNGARAKHLLKSQLPAALAMMPNVALVCIGTNDVLRGDFSPKEIYKVMKYVVDELNRINCTVILLGLPDPMITAPGPIFLRRILQERVNIVNEIFEHLDSAQNVRLIRTLQLQNSKEFWHIDRMHPSPLGHQFIANHVRNSLKLEKITKMELPTESSSSLKFELFWLLTNGTKWFLKRSVDLVPGLIWLILSNKIKRKSDWNNKEFLQS